jgi:sugar phosphate isomerase/epimerase
MLISACTDEVAEELEPALETLTELGLRHADLRKLGGRSVVDLSDAEAARAQELLAGGGFTVTALSTPIGKTPITDDFAPEVQRMERALELARLFGAPYLRVFSFYVDEAEAERYRPEAIGRLRELCVMAADQGVTLAHENEEGGFCAWRPEECLAFQQALPENFRTLFEPCSFTVMGYDPVAEALPLLRDYLAYVHVRDTPRGSTQYTVAGEGDVGWRDLLADLKQHGFGGTLTLEPHLGWQFRPKPTGEQRRANFIRALTALQTLLNEV